MAFPFGIKKKKLKSLTPSTVAVLKSFENQDTLTVSQLINETGYSMRTIRYSLKALLEDEIIEKRVNLANVRVVEYKLILRSPHAQKETRMVRFETDKLKSSVTHDKRIK
ncbi:MAG: ArsR family transcriptional regulator [Candidatus Hodarchaeota archaeon]